VASTDPDALPLEHPNLLSALAGWVSRGPGRPALRYRGRTVTVAELDTLAHAVAAGLRQRGVVSGDRVALCVQNVPQFPVATLGIWRAGAIAVSVSPLLRAHEVDKLLIDAGAVALVVDDIHWRQVIGTGEVADTLRCVLTTAADDLLAVQPAPPAAADSHAVPLLQLLDEQDGVRVPDPATGPDDLAFLTYTSGTTGPAKGACNTHGNIVAGGQVYRDLAGIGPDDVIAGLAPMFHVTGITGHLALAVVSGAVLALDQRFDAASALAMLERERATFTIAAITALDALRHDPSAAQTDLRRLTKVWSGGQAIPAATADALESWLGVPPRNAYGMTETTYPCLMVPAGERAPVDPATGIVAVGRPTPGTRVRVVAEDGTDVPRGEPGELVVRGPGVVPGYWQRPQESAQALAGGYLHTGDVGFVDADGWFFVVDRKKDVINASGFKVWPREVEDVLVAHPAVREAVVVGVPDERRGELVAAFVSLVPGVSAAPDELIGYARERLAAHKYPRRVTVVDEIPKTASGKLMRRAFRNQ